ncbi:hypothetical protein ACFX13_002748 [Malus domestica]
MVTLNYGLSHYSDSAAQMLLLNPVTGALHSEATTEFSAFAASADATFSMPVDLREILPSTLKQAARSRAGEHKKTFERVCGTEGKFVDLSPTTVILAHVCTSFCWLSLVLIAPPGPPQLSNNFLSKGDRTRCTVDP